MGLETGSYIQDLNASNPFSTDIVSEGDDHLRLVKKILKKQFPSLGAQAVTISASAINNLSGVKSNVQAQIDALVAVVEANDEIPPGAAMLFYNAWSSALFGANWKFAALPDNYMVVVNNANGGTNGGTAGGSVDPTNFSHFHTTDGHRLTQTEVPLTIINLEDGAFGRAIVGSSAQLEHNHGNTGAATTSLLHGKFLLLTRL